MIKWTIFKKSFDYQIDKHQYIFNKFLFFFSDVQNYIKKLYYVSSINYKQRKEMDRKRDI